MEIKKRKTNESVNVWLAQGNVEHDLSLLCNVVQATSECAVIGIDSDGDIVFWNDGAYALYGYSALEMIGQRNAACLHIPEDLKHGKHREIVAHAAMQGRWDGEITNMRKDGSRFKAQLSVAPRLGSSGKPIGYMLVTRMMAGAQPSIEASRHAVAAAKDLSLAKHEIPGEHLLASEHRYRLLVESVQDYAIMMLDPDGCIISWNSGAEHIKGYRAQEILGKHCRSLYLPEDVRNRKPELELAMARCYGRWEDEGWRLRKDGTHFWANVVITALRDPDGTLRGFGKVMRDMTERMHAENKILQINKELEERVKQRFQELVSAEEKLGNILESIDCIVWSASPQKFLYINSSAEKIFGRTLAEFYANRSIWFEAIHSEDRPRVREAIESLRGSESVTQEYRIVRPNGEICWLEGKARAISDAEGYLIRIDGVATDISERKRYESHIEYLAGHDLLTGLANRHLLEDRLQMAILHARRNQRLLALLFLDLNRFKYVNDSFGHGVGDQLLKQVAQRLKKQVRESDTVFRQGGDEFIILLTDLHSPDEAAIIASKLIDAFAPPFMVDGHELHMTASIGATICPDDSSDIEILVQNADTAMYRAKAEHASGFLFYSREMRTRARERVKLENALRRAVRRKEFQLWYQPKVELDTGRIVGAEALLRWNDPEIGPVEPSRFIPLAEEVGLIVPIGKWVLETACRQNKAWQDAGLAPIDVAVNLSVSQLRQDELVGTVRRALQQSGLHGRHLELEVTESLVMNSAEQYISKLRALKALGVQLSVDDFGTGYSSLSYLKRFSLDRLKIDQSFIHDIATDSEDAAITRSVIALGHSLNLKVIAEGVETPEQLRFLRDNHCDEIQGYYFSEPLPAEQFAELLYERRTLM